MKRLGLITRSRWWWRKRAVYRRHELLADLPKHLAEQRLKFFEAEQKRQESTAWFCRKLLYLIAVVVWLGMGVALALPGSPGYLHCFIVAMISFSLGSLADVHLRKRLKQRVSLKMCAELFASPEKICMDCKYNLKGCEGTECPECGSAIRPPWPGCDPLPAMYIRSTFVPTPVRSTVDGDDGSVRRD